MFHDSLDLFTPRSRFTATGKYWEAEPYSPDIGAQLFNYEYVDPLSSSYRRLFKNMQSFEAGEVAIRTNDQLNYKNNGIVLTQDGQAFRIIQVAKDFSAAPKQAMRLFGTPISVQYVLRMVTAKNTWGIK